jgi:glycosyltransferase involved in cell wall biosynthesis
MFVFPSLYEGTGGAAIEAMALGLPIVTSDIPSMREVVGAGESAVLVPPGDPAPLADAIALLLSDRDKMKQLGRRGSEMFQERFTLERSALRMVELYRDLITKGRG